MFAIFIHSLSILNQLLCPTRIYKYSIWTNISILLVDKPCFRLRDQNRLCLVGSTYATLKKDSPVRLLASYESKSVIGFFSQDNLSEA